MNLSKKTAEAVWSYDDWARLERTLRRRTNAAASEKAAWDLTVSEACKVMRFYTTSFFIVSRFLPRAKRRQVEIVYAAVRYPDEIVDTFPITAQEKNKLLDEWQTGYEDGLRAENFTDALRQGTPCFLAAFTCVVKDKQIPAEYYRSFLDAMRRDAAPRPFSTLEDLIENYIYGSAVVVGYFLAYIYGSSSEKDFERAKRAARELGIALQLTNFLRDVSEDQLHRGRVYLPLDMLKAAGIEKLNVADAAQHEKISTVVRRMCAVAEDFYASAQDNLDAFSPDSRTAIRSCIKVYRRLNERIAKSNQSILQRESVPLMEKFRVLPASKYWRIPFAYLIR